MFTEKTYSQEMKAFCAKQEIENMSELLVGIYDKIKNGIETNFKNHCKSDHFQFDSRGENYSLVYYDNDV